MINAAGILFLDPDGRALFLRRSGEGDAEGLWALPGGKIEDDENAAGAAVRETVEETGFNPGDPGILHHQRVKDGVDFTTYLRRLDEPFKPKLNEEHTAHVWLKPAEALTSLQLHPGVVPALQKLDADELCLARMMAAGELTSPQRYHNMTLYNIRITGTGVSYRPQLDEFVFRKPENYLTDEFLARCNGLPVIMQHPKDSILNSDEFAERVVGTVMLPYILGDEVWAIAKIFDDETIKLLENKQMSTSPAVLLDKGQKLTLEDGKKLLVEGKPSLLDHIAICSVGVWDKGEGPTGIEATVIGDSAMAEESKHEEDKKADAARADAERRADEKLDMLLKGIDSLRSDFGGLHKRMDAMEEEGKKGEEKKDAEEPEGEGEEIKAKELAADKSRKDSRRRKDSEEERKDSEEEKEERKDAMEKRKDSEEEKEEERKDSARADAFDVLAAQNRDLQRQLSDLSKLVRQPIADSHREELLSAQARADEILIQLGKRAPQPLVGEAPVDYRRRVVSELKPLSDQWKGVRLDGFNDAAFDLAERQIYADAAVRAKTPVDIPTGRMREVRKTTPAGHTVAEFYSDTHFVRGFSRRPRRVQSIFTGR